MEAVAIYKLIILYMLDRAGGELSMPRVSTFLIENGYVNFETLLQTYDEIERNGFAEILQKDGMKVLSITQEGEETLDFFSDQLRDEMKQQVRQYLKETGRDIANEKSIIGDYYRSSYGGFTAHLVIKEPGRTAGSPAEPVLAIDLSVPDEESARRMVELWKERSADVYRYLLTNLL